jgi:phosphoribosylglycinamide formyltransferase 1
MKKNTAVLISGGGSNLQALIDACKDPDFPARIVLVISNKNDAYGLARARKANIPTQVISHKDFPDREAFDGAIHAALVQCGADIICLAGFMRLLTAGLVSKWTGRMINIHPSLLPAFRGMDTHKQALGAGVKIHGCTVHHVVPEMDAGPIIIQAAVPVLAGDSPETLGARVLVAEHKIYPLALRALIEDASDDNRANAGAELINK